MVAENLFDKNIFNEEDSENDVFMNCINCRTEVDGTYYCDHCLSVFNSILAIQKQEIFKKIFGMFNKLASDANIYYPKGVPGLSQKQLDEIVFIEETLFYLKDKKTRNSLLDKYVILTRLIKKEDIGKERLSSIKVTEKKPVLKVSDLGALMIKDYKEGLSDDEVSKELSVKKQ